MKYQQKLKMALFILLIIFFGLFEFDLPKVDAADEIYCTTDVDGDYSGDCESNAEDCTAFCSGYTGTCTVNSRNTNIESSFLPMTALNSCVSESLSFPKTRKCKTGSCPSNNDPVDSAVGTGLSNGDPCEVRVLSGTTVHAATGLWDASEYKCISNPCLLKKEINICGNSGSLTISGSLCTAPGDMQFELACGGVDAFCDEKVEGDSCALGACDSNGQCIAAPTPTPTPSPTPTPTPSITPSPTPSITPTPTGTGTPTPTGSPTPTPSPSSTPTPSPTSTVDCDPKANFFCNPLRGTVDNLVQGGQKIIAYVLGLVGSIALLFIIVAGMMYMTSAGNEERIASSKKILTGAIIGVAITLLAYSFLQVIMSILNM